MSTTNLVILTMKLLELAILINQISCTDYSGLLSRLYKRAAASDRPLIVLIDSNILQSDRQIYKKPSSILDAIAFNSLDYRGTPASNLLEEKNRSRNKNLFKPKKSYDIEKKLHHALLPVQKKIVTREKDILRSPIIRNLLRISNNLKCQARNECEDQCNNKYTGPKNNNCVNTCESKFVCEEEPEESGCDECEANSCGGDECQGSTKGYAETDPPVGCPEC